MRTILLAAACLPICVGAAPIPRGSEIDPPWPMFGGRPDRNMVNEVDRGLPDDWSVKEGKHKNIKWVAKVGRRTLGSPIVAGGKVFLATNNLSGAIAGVKKQTPVLLAFRESDGKLLWHNSHEISADQSKRQRYPYLEPSTPAYDGKGLFYVTPAGEVICADVGTGAIRWRYAMFRELKVCFGGTEFCGVFQPPLASPLVFGDHVFVTTDNGIGKNGELTSPDAPSFIALKKSTGTLAWKSNLPGKNIVAGQAAGPVLAAVNGVPQVIFAGGDGVLYSFVPETGALIWKCDCVLVRDEEQEPTPYFVATPVVAADKLYVGLGAIAHPISCHFLCLDLRKKGDVSLNSYDAKAAMNKDSALIWAYGGKIVPRPNVEPRHLFGRTRSSAAVLDGFVYIAEETGYFHCLDAATGRAYWKRDLKSGVWGSPLWVDGRIFLGDQDGVFHIFMHGRDGALRARIEMDEPIESTPVVANGVLYVVAGEKLYAIARR